jgi:hypothetical protein
MGASACGTYGPQPKARSEKLVRLYAQVSNAYLIHGLSASTISPVVVIPHAHCDVLPRGKAAKSVSVGLLVTELPFSPKNEVIIFQERHVSSVSSPEPTATGFEWIVRRVGQTFYGLCDAH